MKMAAAALSPLASSVEKTNGAKLSRLLIDGGTTALRNAFYTYHPPANLAAVLNANYRTLNNLLKKRVLRTAQWDQLFPPGGAMPDSKTFDITLLFLLLTNICGLTPPLSGWHTKPRPSDTSFEANLARIKFFGNELYGHVSTTSIDTPTFTSLWQEISAVLVALGLIQAEIDRLKAGHCGEEDYLDVLLEWADSEEDIKSQLKNIRQSQTETQQDIGKVLQTQLEDRKILENSKSKVDEVHQTQTNMQETIRRVRLTQLQDHETLLDNKLKLDEVHQSQTNTQEIVEGVVKTQEEHFETLQEVKEAVDSLGERRDTDREEEVLRNLAKSEFRGDIEYHVGRFQEGTREWVFNKVQNWLDDRNSQNRVMLISSNAGMGKSVISAIICKRMQEAGRLSGSHFCQHDNARYRNPHLMLQSLACHLCHALPEYRQALVKQLSRNLGKDLNNMSVNELFALLFKEPLSTVGDPGRNMLMVVDGLDESEYQERNELLDVIVNHFCMLPPWIRFLCTTRPERNITKALKQLKPFLLEPNEEENVQDIRRLFEERMQYLMKPQSKDTIVKKLVEKSEGLMLYAHFLASYIEENVSVLDQEDLDASLPLNISSVYESYFKRLENELLKEVGVEENNFLNLLCAVTASREPLPIDIVSKVLAPCAKSLVERRKVQKVINSVSSLLPIRKKCLHVFHKSVKDWLTDKLCYGEHDFTVDEKEGHRILASLCSDKLDNLKQKGVHDTQFGSTVKFAIRHGARHMLQLHEDKRSRSLKEIVQSYVLDLELMYAKLCLSTCLAAEEISWLQSQKTSQVHGEDIKRSLSTLTFLLRRHFNTFANHPHVFFQTVLNEGGPVLSSVASNLLQNKYPEIPFMEFVHKQMQQGAVVARFQCSSRVVCFDVSPRLDYMVCECEDGTIQLWSINKGNREWTKPVLENKRHRNNAYRQLLVQEDIPHYYYFMKIFDDDVAHGPLSFYRSVVFHPNGKFVLPGSLCEVYTISGEKTLLFSKSNCRFSVCTFVNDNTRMQLLTDCPTNSKCIVLWNLDTGEEISRITRNEDVFCFQCSADGALLAISHVTGLICLVDLVNGLTELGEISTSKACGFMNFSPDNQALSCLHLGDCSKCLFRLSIVPGNPFQEVDQISSDRPFSLFECSPENAFLVGDASGNSSKQLSRVTQYWETGFLEQLNDTIALMGSPDLDFLTLINLDKLKEIRQESDPAVSNITFSRNGAIVYVGSEMGRENQATVSVWDCSSWERKAEKQMRVISLVPVKEGVVVLMTGEDGQDSRPELWDVELSECKRQWINLEGIRNVIPISDEKVACVGDGNVFVLSTTGDLLEKVAYDNQEMIVAINTKIHMISIRHVEYFRFPFPFCVCCLINATTQWECDWGRVDEDNPTPLCTFSPKEEFCVIWDIDRVRVLDADTGELHCLLFRERNYVDCKFVNDKDLIVCSEEDRGNFLRMFDVNSGELLNLIEIEEQPFCLGTCLQSLHIAVGLSGSEFKVLRVHLPQVEDNRKSERGLDNLGAIESKQATGSSLKRRGESPSCSSSKRSKVTPDHSAAAVIKEGTPEDVELESLAEKIPGHWKKLGRRLLEGDEALLEAIHKENEEYSEKAYKMLLKWKRAKGSRATFCVLHEALCHPLVDRQDLAEEICLEDHG